MSNLGNCGQPRCVSVPRTGCINPCINVCAPCAPTPPPPFPCDSPMEAINRLNQLVLRNIGTVNDLSTRVNSVLDEISGKGIRNGAYYGSDVVEIIDGFSPDESCPWRLVRIRNRDSQCNPVTLDMHLAFSNTANTGIMENAFDASEFQLAQIMVPAIAPSTQGWHGNAVWQFAPIPSRDVNLFTYGFSRSGKLRVYRDAFLTANPTRLRNDEIQYAMGCTGILIENGTISSGANITNIVDYTVQRARVSIAQNYTTGDTFIFTCGEFGEIHNGMTSLSVANVLMGYGVDVAVELISGEKAIALDRGGLMFPPYDNTISSHNAYIYLSKKKSFVSEIQHDLALMTQLMNRLIFENGLQTDDIDRLWEALFQEIEDRTNQDNSILSALQIERDVRAAADNALGVRIDNEIEDRELADSALDVRIDNEIEDRQLADAAIIADLDALAADVDARFVLTNERLSELEDNLQAEIERSSDEDAEHTAQLIEQMALITGLRSDMTVAQQSIIANRNLMLELTGSLRDDVNALQILYGDIQSQLSAIDANIVNILQSINSIEIALAELKGMYDALNGQVTALTTRVTTAENKVTTMAAKVDYVYEPKALRVEKNAILTFKVQDEFGVQNVQLSVYFHRWGDTVFYTLSGGQYAGPSYTFVEDFEYHLKMQDYFTAEQHTAFKCVTQTHTPLRTTALNGRNRIFVFAPSQLTNSDEFLVVAGRAGESAVLVLNSINGHWSYPALGKLV